MFVYLDRNGKHFVSNARGIFPNSTPDIGLRVWADEDNVGVST